MFLLLLAVACTPPGDDTGAPGDTGPDTSADTGTPPSTWPPYAPEPSWTSSDPGYATGGAWADLDGDGIADLVVAYGNDMAPGPLAVHHGGAGGELAEAADWESAELAYHGHLATGDVDGDGWTDVVVAVFLGPAGFDEPGGVALYRNDGGTLPPTPTWESPDRFWSFSVALGDVDNDGDLDLAAASGEPYEHAPDLPRLYLNEGGAFSDSPDWMPAAAEARHTMDVAFLDADGDGWLDLAFAAQGAPHVLYRNDGAGRPVPTASWEATGDRADFEGNTLDFGDLDGDGALDLVVSDNNQLGGRGTVRAWCGPDLHACWEQEDPPDMQSAVALADLDGDGDPDLLAGSWWGPVRLYENVGGALAPEPCWQSASEWTVAEAFALHDLDLGGVEETFTAPGPLVPLPRECAFLESHPPGTLGDRYLTAPGADTVEITCRRSSRLDLLVTDWTAGHGNDLYLHLGPVDGGAR